MAPKPAARSNECQIYPCPSCDYYYHYPFQKARNFIGHDITRVTASQQFGISQGTHVPSHQRLQALTARPSPLIKWAKKQQAHVHASVIYLSLPLLLRKRMSSIKKRRIALVLLVPPSLLLLLRKRVSSIKEEELHSYFQYRPATATTTTEQGVIN